MGRIYLDANDSPLKAIVDGYMTIKNRQDDVKDRRAKERAANDTTALDKFKGYVKGKYDDDGVFNGYEENREAIDRDRPVLKNLANQFFEQTTKPAVPVSSTAKDAQGNMIPDGPDGTADLDAKIKAETDRRNAIGDKRPVTMSDIQGAAPAPAPPAPPMNPPALISSPAEQEAAKAALKPEEKQGGLPQGGMGTVSQDRQDAGAPNVRNADITRMSAPGISISATPQQPAEVARYNPSPALLADIESRVTNPSQRDSDPMIPVPSLPEDLQELLGMKGFRGALPASLIKARLEYQKVPAKAEADASKIQLSPETYDVMSQVEKGVPLATGLRMLAQKQGGKSPNPNQIAALKTAAVTFLNEQNRGENNRDRDDARADKNDEKSDRQLERFEKAYEKTGIAAALSALQRLENTTGAVTGQNVDLSKLPGTGTNFLRSLPLVGNAASTMAAKTYGGEEVQQALQALVNTQIKTNSGTAVSKTEEGRNLITNGMGPGGNEKDVQRGIQLMKEGFAEADRAVRAGYPKVTDKFAEGGGQKSLDQEIRPRQKPEGKEAPQGYQSELRRSKQMLADYRAGLQAQMLKEKRSLKWASQQVDEKKKQVDAYLNNKYGKGFTE